MDSRNFWVIITPIKGGADRSLHFKCLNFGEAEGLAVPHIGDGEFISRIEQEFPVNRVHAYVYGLVDSRILEAKKKLEELRG